MVAKHLIFALYLIFAFSLLCLAGQGFADDAAGADTAPFTLKKQEAELEKLFSQIVFDLAQSAYHESTDAQKDDHPRAPADPDGPATINQDTTIIALVDCAEIAGNYIRLIDVATFRRDPNKLEGIISDLIISPAPAMDKSCHLTREQITKRLAEYNIPMNNISFTGAQEILVLRTKAATPDQENPVPPNDPESQDSPTPPEKPAETNQPVHEAKTVFSEKPETKRPATEQPAIPTPPIMPSQSMDENTDPVDMDNSDQMHEPDPTNKPDPTDNPASMDSTLPIGSAWPRSRNHTQHLDKDAPVLIVREGALFRMEEWGTVKTAGRVGDHIEVADRHGRIFPAKITCPNTVVPMADTPNTVSACGHQTIQRP